MKADTISLQQAFQSWCRLEVPLYQRPYVWNQRQQWEPLWSDLLAAAARREQAEAGFGGGSAQRVPHFVGAIVLEQVPTTLGSIQTRLVIDGQQRLTTLQILLEALGDHARLTGHATAEALLMLTRNPATIVSHPDFVFKVWPTNLDRDVFRRVMLAKSADDLLVIEGLAGAPVDTDHQIRKCYLYFFSAIGNWLAEEPELRDVRLRLMFDTLAQDIQLVTIELQGADDPQLIFETLNARGTPLLPADLIKNYLFSRLSRSEVATNLVYEETWGEFDRGRKYWREQVGRGHAQRPRIDMFMQFYLSAKMKSEVQGQHLYANFKQFASAGKEPVEALLKDIRSHADLFRSFDKRASQEPPDRAALFLRRLAAMDLGSVYPFLLAMLSQHSDLGSPGVLAVLSDVESFLVRRLVCRLSTRGYGRFFLDLIECISPDLERTRTTVRAQLSKTSAEVGRWPSDQEFDRAWLDDAAYENHQRGKVRMLLEAIEYEMMSPLGAGHWVASQPTIEHVLPQAWKTHWPLSVDASSEAAQARDRALHTFGNLTLLSGPLNSTLSNAPWPEKRKEISKHAMFQLNVEIAASEQWDEAQIRARAEKQLVVAKNIWPGLHS